MLEKNITLNYHILPINYNIIILYPGSAIQDYFRTLFAGQDCLSSFPTCDGECPATLDCEPTGFSCECFCTLMLL